MNLVKSNEVNNAGKIGLRPRGTYSESETYNFLDFVYYGGASYVAKKETTGNTPAENNEYWQILAQGGNDSVTIGNETVEFVEATVRENISSGEMVKTMLGKIKKWYADFKAVAFTGSYNDLLNKPTIPSVGNGTLTIQKNGTNVQTFAANQSGNATANITVPTNAAGVGAVATSKVLTTKEQINANTDTTNVAGATAVKAMISEINSNICKKNLLNIELRAYTSSSSDITGTLPQIPCENYKKIRIRGSSSDRTHSIYTPSGTLLLSAGTSTSYGNEADISKIDHFIPYCSLGTSTLYYMFTE